MAINQTTTDTGEWVDARRELPPEGIVVQTRIPGFKGPQALIREGRRYLADFGNSAILPMYVSLKPTHWFKVRSG